MIDIKPKYWRVAILILVIFPAVPFLVFNIGYLSYVFWPRDFSDVTELPIPKDMQYLTLSAHGVKDTPQSWSNHLQSLLAVRSTKKQQLNHSLDWQQYSSYALTCSVYGKEIGRQIGLQLVKQKQLEFVHIIGHSCGSFVVYGLCQQLKKSRPEIKVHTTYLDPASVYAGFWWDYGIERFGSCADFSDVYIDTEDNVPGSNLPLPHAHTFDVTRIRIKKSIKVDPHYWPAQYYLEELEKGKVPLLFENQRINNFLKAGKVNILE